MLDALTDPQHGVIGSLDEVKAVGHRVALRRRVLPSSCIVTEEVREKIRSLFEIAPLHNPANLEGVLSIEKVSFRACRRLRSSTPRSTRPSPP